MGGGNFVSFRRKGKENIWKKRIKYKIFLIFFAFLDLSQ